MTSIKSQKPAHNKNAKMVKILVLVTLGALGLGFSAKPLYNTFCRVTGYGGTTQVAEQASKSLLDREITVRFDTNIDKDVGWTFTPDQRSVKVKLGQNTLVYFTAHNNTDKTIVGTANYNVTPYKAAPYFSKLECFCFTEQSLAPGETAHMPVLFFVDTEMAKEERMNDIDTIILSYTFHKAKNITDDVITTERRAAHNAEAVELEKELKLENKINTDNDTQGRG